MSTLSTLFSRISQLARETGDALQLRGFKTGGTAGQVPTKINGTAFNWSWQTPAGGSGGTGDHGDLTGLGDDDHTQYLNNARGDARYITINGNAGTPSSIVLTNATGNASALSVNFAVSSLYANDAGMAGGVARSGIITALISDPLPITSGGTGGSGPSSLGTFRTDLGLNTHQSVTFAGLTVASGSITTSQPLALTQTWSTTATYTGLLVNVTDSGPSNAASLLMDLQVGGASRFRVRKDGIVVFGNNASIEGNSSGKIIIRPSTGVNLANCAAQGFHANSAGTIGFAITTPDGAIDTGISRKTSTPGTLMVGNGTANNASGSIELANLTASGSIILPTSTTPASAGAAGVAGTIVRDANYLYVCTATNTWTRIALAW